MEEDKNEIKTNVDANVGNVELKDDGLPAHEYIPGRFGKITKEHAAAYGKIGGTHSGEVRRQKKAMKYIVAQIMGMPMKRGKKHEIETVKAFEDFKGKNLDVQTSMAIKQFQNALKGDKQAFMNLLQVAGEIQPPGANDESTGEQIIQATDIIFRVRRQAPDDVKQPEAKENADTTDSEPVNN